jgi:eukaryotic-like serine/threonine-protein kinase
MLTRDGKFPGLLRRAPGYTPSVATHTREKLLAGRYRIERTLGSGGMATVLLCEDIRLGRRVAVKRLHVHSPEDTARRFVREAKLGAALNHPNLVTVLDSLPDEDAVLIVMEYVPGESLDVALRRGPLDPDDAVRMVRDVAAALDNAHSKGVIHRDVKPGNVLLRNDGVAKLVDLGIATAADITRITSSGVLLGTSAYMAPEQLEGDEATASTDVFSLATVAFEAFSGRKARPGRSPLEIAHKLATEPPPDVRQHWRGAPAGLAEALKDGMAREPTERPRSAGALAERIEAAMRGPLPRPVSQPPRRRRRSVPPSRRPGVAALAAAAVAAVALAVGAVSLLTGGDEPSKPAGKKRGNSQEQRSDRDAQSRQPSGPATPTAPLREAPTPQPSTPGAAQSAGDAATGARLNQQGYALMQRGNYRDAVAILRRAVAAFPKGTTDINYAYALYNLGRSLRLSGRPAEAVPILERRLRIPNQRDVVRRELDAARREASTGGSG